jgi:hypothetical protein
MIFMQQVNRHTNYVPFWCLSPFLSPSLRVRIHSFKFVTSPRKKIPSSSLLSLSRPGLPDSSESSGTVQKPVNQIVENQCKFLKINATLWSPYFIMLFFRFFLLVSMVHGVVTVFLGTPRRNLRVIPQTSFAAHSTRSKMPVRRFTPSRPFLQVNPPLFLFLLWDPSLW